MSFNAIRENNILAKISEFTVCDYFYPSYEGFYKNVFGRPILKYLISILVGVLYDALSALRLHERDPDSYLLILSTVTQNVEQNAICKCSPF